MNKEYSENSASYAGQFVVVVVVVGGRTGGRGRVGAWARGRARGRARARARARVCVNKTVKKPVRRHSSVHFPVHLFNSVLDCFLSRRLYVPRDRGSRGSPWSLCPLDDVLARSYLTRKSQR